MAIYKDRNFQVDEILAIEFQDKLDGNFKMFCEVNGVESFVMITQEQFEEIKALHGCNLLLYMYSHRSHRGWKIDGFLPTSLDIYTLLDENPMHNKVKKFNQVKENYWNMKILENNQEINKVYLNIKQHGYKTTDDTLANCSHEILTGIIEKFSLYQMEVNSRVNEVVKTAEKWELKLLQLKQKKNG